VNGYADAFGLKKRLKEPRTRAGTLCLAADEFPDDRLVEQFAAGVGVKLRRHGRGLNLPGIPRALKIAVTAGNTPPGRISSNRPVNRR